MHAANAPSIRRPADATLFTPVRIFAAAFVLGLGLGVYSAHAQSNVDGSLYSRFGIGELQSFSSSQIEAMGGVAPSMHSLNYLNFSNPGTWSDLVLTRAAAGFTYQNITISDAAENESRLASGFLNAVQFSFPLLERKLGVAIGFVPYSRVSYHVEQPGTLLPSSTRPDTVDYTVNFEGSGGLQQVVGGLGYRFNSNFSAGVSVQGYFGIIDNGRRTSFLDTGYQQTNVSVETRLAGISATLGSTYSARRLFSDEDVMIVGAAFTLPTSLSGERVRTLGEGLDRDTLGTTDEGSVHLPLRVEGGISYYPGPRWILTAGGKYEPWTDFESDFAFPGLDVGGDPLSDRIRGGAGVEFIPAGSDLLAPFVARVAYRLGFYYDRSYISPSADEGLNTMALTGGLSIPTQMSGTRIDLNLEVGKRGSAEDNLVQDVFYRLSANVNIGERWFQQTKLR